MHEKKKSNFMQKHMFNPIITIGNLIIKYKIKNIENIFKVELKAQNCSQH